MTGRFPILVAAALAVLSLAGCQHAPRSESAPAEPAQFRLDASNGRDEQMVTDVRINGRSARLGLDTGAAAPFFLFAPHVARLGLKVVRAPAADSTPTPGTTMVGVTAPARLEMLGQTLHDVPIYFGEVPPEIPLEGEIDGVIGWPAMSGNAWIFIFSENPPVIAAVESVAHDGPGWTTFTVPEGDTLSLNFGGVQPGLPRVIVDTGNGGGVLLPPDRWREWKAAHPDAPKTIHAGYMFGQRLAAGEVAWADEIRVGELVFRGVPVTEADPAYLRKGAEGEEIVVLGVAALKRLDLIVDARAKVAYARPLENPPSPYLHNRTGVVFIPAENFGDDLVAHVVADSPAFRAGVRDGDVLLMVNQQDVAGWRKNPAKLRKVFNTHAPAGTKWELTVRRNGVPQTVQFIAEDLLGPQAASSLDR